MFQVEQFCEIERECDFLYPSGFRAIARDLIAIAGSPTFALAFPRSRLMSAAAEIKSAWAANLPETLVPFMCEEQLKHTDYYCFERSESRRPPSVVVFAADAVVHDWADFDSFLSWLRQRCSVTGN